MKFQNLKEDKRGLSTGKIAALIGALIFIVLVVSLSPTMFNGINSDMGGPAWMITVLPIVVAAGLVMAVYKAFR